MSSTSPPSIAPPPDPGIRIPQQDRSRRTLERLITAAVRILEAEGPEALTITRITEEAHTSVGSFYARFQGKDDLVRYMAQESFEETVREWRR